MTWLQADSNPDHLLMVSLLGLPYDFRYIVELQTSLSTLEKWAEPLREQRLLALRGK